MSDPKRRAETDPLAGTPHDPDLGSTWNTIDGTADVEDLIEAEEMEDFLMEPTEGELGILADSDVPGAPG